MKPTAGNSGTRESLNCEHICRTLRACCRETATQLSPGAQNKAPLPVSPVRRSMARMQSPPPASVANMWVGPAPFPHCPDLSSATADARGGRGRRQDLNSPKMGAAYPMAPALHGSGCMNIICRVSARTYPRLARLGMLGSFTCTLASSPSMKPCPGSPPLLLRLLL